MYVIRESGECNVTVDTWQSLLTTLTICSNFGFTHIQHNIHTGTNWILRNCSLYHENLRISQGFTERSKTLDDQINFCIVLLMEEPLKYRSQLSVARKLINCSSILIESV